MLRRLRRRLRAEHGFTLTELLVGMLVGMIVLVAAFDLLDRTVKSQRVTQDRILAVSRARGGVEQMTRELRSQACMGKGIPSLISATTTSVTFYASLAEPTMSGVLPIEKRQLTYANGAVTETTWIADTGTRPPDSKFTGAPTTRLLMDGIAPAKNLDGTDRPFFRYHKYDPTFSPQVAELVPAPDLTGDQRSLAVRVDFEFDSFPDGSTSSTDPHKTVFKGQVFVRTADPTDPTHSPKCI